MNVQQEFECLSYEKYIYKKTPTQIQLCLWFLGGRFRKSIFITRQEEAAEEAEAEEELQEQWCRWEYLLSYPWCSWTKLWYCDQNSTHPISSGPSHSVVDDEDEEESEEETEEEGKRRRRSDSYSLTFDDSLSWCVIGGLGGGRDRHSSQSSDSHSTVSISNTHTHVFFSFSFLFLNLESLDWFITLTLCVCVCVCVWF